LKGFEMSGSDIGSILDKLGLRGKGLLTLHDLADDELLGLLDLSSALKAKKKAGTRGVLLEGRNIAMVFEKMSTRTRSAIVVSAADEGGMAEYLPAGEIHVGGKESIPDTARVLGRMFDGIFFRGFLQETAELLLKWSGVPVWNGLTDETHPTQVLADLLTVRESFGQLKGLKMVYIGDGRNNVASSLMTGCAKVGMDCVNCTPPELTPEDSVLGKIGKIAGSNGCSVSIVNDPAAAVAGANVIYTDVWASMGEESKIAERIALLRPYQVNMDLLKKTGNLDCGKVIFLHCLPAFHDANTAFTKDTGALEVTDDVFEAPFSKVFDGAENRVHTIKAVMTASLAGIVG
jgi:ornithine carbamoyltransferase